MPRSTPALRRPIVYCVVPVDLAARLHELLRRHFRDHPEVKVVVERRSGDRRGLDRRSGDGTADQGSEERRRVRFPDGRRGSDRRAAAVIVDPPRNLPRKAEAYRDRLVFLQRLEPTAQEQEDHDSTRLVAAFQAGDREAFATLYMRYFDRIYGYLNVVLRDAYESEDATQQVFHQALEALPRYEQRGTPFRAWLFVIARNYAIAHSRRLGRLAPVDPAELPEPDPSATDGLDTSALQWLSDREILMLIERLPLPQRQVLVLRFMFEMSAGEIAEALEISPNHVSVLQYRALGFLRARLSSLGRTPRGTRRTTAKSRFQQAPVLRWRRYTLTP